MRRREAVLLAGLIPAFAFAPHPPAWAAAPIAVVAAENFYAGVARQVGGPAVSVTAILSNPDADPHAFEASPSVARAVAGARIVVLNGAGYDPWMARLLRAAPRPGRVVIDVGVLLGVARGANPHLWYDPTTMPLVARRFAADLAAQDPGAAPAIRERLAAFLASLRPLDEKIAAMRRRYAGTPVTATEPVFGYMAVALGLVMRNRRFQIAVMNGTEPRASDVAAFESDLRSHRVRVLLYNRQTTGGIVRRLLRLAAEAQVPVVGVTETEPPGTSYQGWMMQQLDALDAALSRSRP